MRYLVVYDDRSEVPAEIRAHLGIHRYGSIIHRRKTLREAFLARIRAVGCDAVAVLSDDLDAEDLLTKEVRHAGWRVVLAPASLILPDSGQADVFLRKMRYTGEDFLVDGPAGAPAMLFLGWERLGAVLRLTAGGRWESFHREWSSRFHRLPDQIGCRDLTRRETLADLLSGTFDARHFNRMDGDQLVVSKRSTDRAKMRREAAVYDLLPPGLRMFFLPTLAWHEDGDGAGYSTERLFIPDLAVQWIHRSLDRAAFSSLLERIVAFLGQRPTRPGDAGERDALYLGKVRQRTAELARLPVAGPIGHLLSRTRAGSIDGLVQRFAGLWEAHCGPLPRRALSHGDLCFSNILYDRSSRLTKFIDPRGAETLDGLFLDAYYDVAKLSHSVLGSYDVINHDLADLRIGRDLEPELDLRGDDLDGLRTLFIETMEGLGFSYRTLRLCEASLFLSMLPLHADVPKKVLAFALTADRILGELEGR